MWAGPMAGEGSRWAGLRQFLSVLWSQQLPEAEAAERATLCRGPGLREGEGAAAVQRSIALPLCHLQHWWPIGAGHQPLKG